jgi:hypothetical protein
MHALSIVNFIGYCVGLVFLLAAGDRGLNIRVSPQAILAGNSTWLTCRVSPDDKNRKLLFGIAGSEREGSERQLDGSKAPITWGPIEFKRIPCGAGPAYCIVERVEGRPLQAIEQINVGGCEPGTK